MEDVRLAPYLTRGHGAVALIVLWLLVRLGSVDNRAGAQSRRVLVLQLKCRKPGKKVPLDQVPVLSVLLRHVDQLLRLGIGPLVINPLCLLSH